MEVATLTIPLAFLAGLLSFASPCVLPLVPAYLGYLGSTTVVSSGQTGSVRKTNTPFAHALAFVLGFMVVFILLGASATFVGQILLDYRSVLERVGSVLLVIFGMRLMAGGYTLRRWLAAAVVIGLVTFVLNAGWLVGEPIQFGDNSLLWLAESVMMAVVVMAGAELALPWQVSLAVVAGSLNMLVSFDEIIPRLITSLLIAIMVVLLNRTEIFYAEKKFELTPNKKGGVAWSFLFGFVFAAGWTPCIGPILAGILIVASQLDTVSQGVLFLTVYSLGLGIPFLLFGLAFGPVSKAMRGVKRYLGITSVISGVLLVLMGILLLTGSLDFLARYGSFFDVGL